MGLSAGQARLLSITARKSDCEYKSMQFSHQKLAISRQLEDVSNEYQNSLEQTKLVYDYYGTGTTNTPLTYGILMNPSELNGYYPNLLTDAAGRIVLNEQYANAARAAGIPQEGFNGTPSDTVRNKFIQALADYDIITQARANKFMLTSYNQLSGVGSIASTAITTTEGQLDDLLAMLELNGCDKIAIDDLGIRGTDLNTALCNNNKIDSDSKTISLKDLLTDGSTSRYTLVGASTSESGDGGTKIKNGEGRIHVESAAVVLKSSQNFINQLYENLASVLDTGDAYTQSALEYAYNEIMSLITIPNEDYNNVHEYVKLAEHIEGYNYKMHEGSEISQNIIGLTVCKGKVHPLQWRSWPVNSVSLNNLAQAFLTNFAKYMEGLAVTNNYHAEGGRVTDPVQNFVTKDPNYTYIMYTGTSLTEDEMKLVNSYDSILNQLCSRGWTENREIDDQTYLQEMLQGGMMFLTKIKDDGYYYQTNYATDSYIKTVEDETAIAQAEAKYTMEKQKLNNKENSLDMKMKKLDTEISALTTEYDTVKGTIQKNIDRSFKRYQA